MARPTKYSAKLAADICAQLMEGNSLRKIASQSSMPAARTIFQWLATNDGFAQQYAYAREVQADVYFDAVVDIADTQEKGERVTFKDDGKVERVVEDMIAHRRLKIDARKWSAAKLAPKKYGEKIEHDHNGNITINLGSLGGA